MSLVLLATGGLAAVAAVLLIRLLRPLLATYATARPNARSSHTAPTPQGGGIAVLIAAALAIALGLAWTSWPPGQELAIVAGAAFGLALLGGIDDIRPLPAGLRLAAQLACVAALVLATGLRLAPALPQPVEQAILILAGLWWVNLVNFMDGIDWMSVVEIVPLTLGLSLFGLMGFLPPTPTLVAAALAGGMLGFAPANRPVARLFLGDAGSLPLGLLTGWLLLHLAGSGGFAAACLLPMYYLADATLTLLRRLARRERVWEAHRQHFYQRALDHGWRVIEVDRRVVALNLALLVLAGATLALPAWPIEAAALLAGAALTAATLRAFAHPRSL